MFDADDDGNGGGREGSGGSDYSVTTAAELGRHTGPVSYDVVRADTDLFYAVAVGAPLHVLRAFPLDGGSGSSRQQPSPPPQTDLQP